MMSDEKERNDNPSNCSVREKVLQVENQLKDFALNNKNGNLSGLERIASRLTNQQKTSQ